MSLLKKWNKNLIPSLSNFNSFFDDSLFDSANNEMLPAVNIKDVESAYEIEVATPGFTKDDLEVKISDSSLVILANTEKENAESTDTYTRKEFSHSSFTRSFFLSEEVDRSNIEAEYKDGLLKIKLPKHYNPVKENSKFIKIK